MTSLPFSQVISSISIWNNKCATWAKACICKIILSTRNIQSTLYTGLIIDKPICRTTFPSDHNIDKPHVKVASCQHILSETSISVLPSHMCFGWWVYLYVCPINGSNSIFEEREELRIIVDNVVDSRAIWLWQVGVTKTWWYYCRKHCLERSQERSISVCYIWHSEVRTHLEMVLLDLWKCSDVIWMLFPVATWYRKLASCSIVVIQHQPIKPPFSTSSFSRWQKTVAETAKFWWIQSVCPWSSSCTYPLPESLDVWYRSGWRQCHKDMYPAEAITVDTWYNCNQNVVLSWCLHLG